MLLISIAQIKAQCVISFGVLEDVVYVFLCVCVCGVCEQEDKLQEGAHVHDLAM